MKLVLVQITTNSVPSFFQMFSLFDSNMYTESQKGRIMPIK